MIKFIPEGSNLRVYKDGLYIKTISADQQSKYAIELEKPYSVHGQKSYYCHTIEEAMLLQEQIIKSLSAALTEKYPQHRIEQQTLLSYSQGCPARTIVICPKQGNCYPIRASRSIILLGEPCLTLPCKRCQGKGTYNTLTGYPPSTCYCKGRIFDYPNRDLILAYCISSKGPTKGLIKTSAPTGGGPRSKYFWRMYRFYTGKDVTLPMMASLDIEEDPYRDLIDDYALELATLHKNLSGLEIWRHALLG